ncbi:hypothetical protein F2Q69_00003195 [Brassica cretica]|uniref:Uncharacterized protein n=1 Tax=Brassica cretica TaxID=69181 RepID=A0A8S9P0A4_BRACR|nr:hypothetical protein F2Q69_00003195 [Brassica cretica]
MANLSISSSNPPCFSFSQRLDGGVGVSLGLGGNLVSVGGLIVSRIVIENSTRRLRLCFFISSRRKIAASLLVARRISSTVENLYLSPRLTSTKRKIK